MYNSDQHVHMLLVQMHVIQVFVFVFVFFSFGALLGNMKRGCKYGESDR